MKILRYAVNSLNNVIFQAKYTLNDIHSNRLFSPQAFNMIFELRFTRSSPRSSLYLMYECFQIFSIYFQKSNEMYSKKHF